MKRYGRLGIAALVCWSCSTPERDPGGAQPSVTLVGTVQWYSFEGGFWAIRGADAITYDPSSPLAVRWQRPDLPVRATVRVRSDLSSFHMAGPIVDVLHIEQLSCVGLPCPAPTPAVSISVAGNDPATAITVPVLDATLSSVQWPPTAGVTPAFDCARLAPQGYTTVTTICFIYGVVPGVYEADVSAPAYRMRHVRVVVPEHVIQPYECCSNPYVSQRIVVDLDPS